MADVAQTFSIDPYSAENARLSRQQKLAEILQQQALQPDQQFSYAGIQAPPSAAGALAKGLQLGMSGYLQGRGMRNSEDLADKMTTERKADMDKIVSALQGTPGAPEVPGSVTATQADVNDREMGPAAANPIALGQQLATGGGMGEGANIGAPAKAAVPGSLEAAQAMMMASKFPDLQAAGLSGMAARQAAKDARLLTLQDAETKAENDRKLKLSPGYRNPVPGVDVPFSQSVYDQQVGISGAKSDAARQPAPGYQNTPTGQAFIPGGPADPATIAAAEEAKKKAAREQAVAKPVPPQILKMERDDRESINTTETINGTLAKYRGLLNDKKLDLGPVTNVISQGRNYAGASDENSRNFASFRSDLEKLRNDSLRLNAGVQTDGDAQRAWNELMANLNDPKVVEKRLGEIEGYNQRAAALKSQNLDQLYDQYPGLKPKEKTEGQPAKAAPPQAGFVKDGYRFKGGEPADPNSWEQI